MSALSVSARLIRRRKISLISNFKFFTTSSIASSSNKLYELRKYTAKPDCIGKFKELSNELLHLRMAESTLVGYWFTEIGSSLFQAVHVWEYDSLTHRAKVRQKLDKKEAWVNNYISHAMPFLAKLENSLVCVPSWFEQPDSCDKQGGIYELVTYNIPLKNQMASATSFKLSVESDPRSNFADLLFVWNTDIGKQSEAFSLWRYDSYEKWTALTNQCKDHDLSSENLVNSRLLMLPAPWSPLQ